MRSACGWPVTSSRNSHPQGKFAPAHLDPGLAFGLDDGQALAELPRHVRRIERRPESDHGTRIRNSVRGGAQGLMPWTIETRQTPHLLVESSRRYFVGRDRPGP
jgi:hypothetical protein